MDLTVEAAAKLQASIDGLAGRVARLDRQLQLQGQIARPHTASWVAVVSNLAAQPTQLNQLTDITSLTGPLGAMVWEVRRITFGQAVGATPLTGGGNLIVYREGVEVARTTTVPNFLTFSGYELMIQPNEDIQIAWWGATVAAGAVPPLICDVMAVEYPQLADSLLVE